MTIVRVQVVVMLSTDVTKAIQDLMMVMRGDVSVESGLQSLSVQVSSKSLFLLIISWFCGNEVIYVYKK